MADAITALTGAAAGNPQPGGVSPKREAELRESAKAFESVFVAQMLSQSGLGKALAADGGFGGEAFSSLLVEQYAGKLVEQGGFGLAEHIYQQLSRQEATRGE